MKIGCVGKPSSGKSTFLNAACLTDAAMAPYPFTTIKPNMGAAYVRAECPCTGLGVKCSPKSGKCENGIRLVPIAMVDVAGLVPGAHLGKGMGNQFLSDLIDADALIHVVDASGRMDAEGNPAKGYDPLKDSAFLEEEMALWLHGILSRGWPGIQKKAVMKSAKLHEAVHGQLSGLNMSCEEIKEAIRSTGVTEKSGEDSLMALAKEIRRRSKPIAVAANKMDLPESAGNLERLKGSADVVEPCCAEAELALRRAAEHGMISYVPGASDFKELRPMPEAQGKALEFIRKNVLEEYGGTGVQQIIDRVAYGLLGLIVVYPVEDEGKYSDKLGNVLPHAYLMRKGSTALDLAFKVHTDIGKAFIGAIDCRTRKRIGKGHELENGDVVKILV